MTRRHTPGLVLIIVGAILLLARQHLSSGDLTVLVIGTLLLVAYAFTGHYGVLVPAGILTGLGAGIALREWTAVGGASVLLGLGAGFLFIYVVDRAREPGREGRVWPVIPGGILVIVGLLQLARVSGAMRIIAAWWPALLIVLGIWMLLRPKPAS